jgi:hypothetical protein
MNLRRSLLIDFNKKSLEDIQSNNDCKFMNNFMIRKKDKSFTLYGKS